MNLNVTKTKKFISLILIVSCLLVTACSGTTGSESEATQTFVDSCGRSVEVPEEIDEVMPSGALAQIFIYTVCPDKLQSLASAFTRVQKKYIDEKYTELPVTGQLYGGGSTVNYEEIIASDPDVIIDIGEAKENIADDMDELQEKTGIPAVFIEANIGNMAEAYDMLGELTGDTEKTSVCAEYIREALDEFEQAEQQIPESERTKVLYSQGEYGTEVLGAGTIHAEVLEYAAAENVAQLSSVSSQGSNEVSMEQILLWNPDVLILSTDANFDEIYDDASWANVKAVQDHRVYEVPSGPYDWIDRPPSVQRILGVKWLGNLLYPDIFNYDMTEEAKEFYSLFFHYELTDDEAHELMANSTYLEDGE